MKTASFFLILICVIGVGGCATSGTASNNVGPDAMLSVCKEKVASWAGTAKAQITGSEVKENPSGMAWDFRGAYPGGTWACGGPAGVEQPTALVAYTNAGGMQDILHDATPLDTASPSDSTALTPEAKLSEQINKSSSPSQACLTAMKLLSDTSFDAPESEQDAAISVTATGCTNSAEYILAVKKFPGAWGFVDASYIDGETALTIIQSACLKNETAPTCIDAAAVGLL